MKRRNFFWLGLSSLAFLFAPVTGWAKKKYITDCKECQRDCECCKTMPKPVYGKEIEILKKLGKKHGKKLNIIFDKERKHHMWRDVPCIFLNKDNRCDIYKYRPFVCRIYYCGDFGFSNKKLEKIEAFHRKDWDFGSKVKL